MINIMKYFFVGICFIANVFSAEIQTILSAEDSFAGWKVAHRLKMTPGKEALKLHDMQADSSIVKKVEIDPDSVKAIQITYRASGIPEKTSGEIYFANSLGDFSDARRWTIPSLQGDGKWHTLLLTYQNLARVKEWTNGGTVTKIRLDMVNSAGGEIEVSKVVLLKNVISQKNEKAKKTSKNAWPVAKTQYLKEQKKGTYFQGFMICSPEDVAKKRPHSFYLRKKFNIPEKVARAYIQFVFDDSGKVYLNGKYIASAANWTEKKTVEVSDSLKEGNNILAAEYYNQTVEGGFLCELFIETVSGKQYKINSDSSFLSSASKGKNWEQETFDDTNWKKAREQNPPPAFPWGKVLPYINFSYPQNYLRAESKEDGYEGQIWNAEFHFKGKIPDKSINATVSLAENGKKIISSEEIVIPFSNFHNIEKDHWVLNFSYRIPQYIRSGNYLLSLKSPDLFMLKGGIPKIKLNIIAKSQRSAMISEIKKTPQGARWFINGKVFYPVWGYIWSRLGTEFGAPKLNLQKLTPPGWWTGIGKYDFSAVDRYVHQILNAHPDRLIMLEISASLPKEWVDKYKSELACHEDGTISPYHGKPFSYASEIARQEMKNAIQQFIKYAEEAPYSSRIVGYFLSGGMTGEWAYWTPARKKMLDYSGPNKKAFKAYSGKDIPSSARRLSRDNNHVLLDPVKWEDCIQFNEYTSESVADMLIDLGRTMQESLKGKQKVTGTYYGYSCYLPLDTGYHTHGHFALKKVLDANLFNMFVSPISYWNRGIGDSAMDMKPFTSIQDRGVLAVIEDDTRLHNMQEITAYHNDYQAVNPEQSTALLKRNLSLALCRDTFNYFYAIYGRRNFDFPQAAEAISAQKVIGTHNVENNIKRNAEIAVVISEKSWLMLSQKRDIFPYNGIFDYKYNSKGIPIREQRFRQHLSGEIITGLVDISRIGAPVDYLLAEDLANSKKDYKLYIFLNAFRYDKAFMDAVQKLRNKKTTLLWTYAPGYYWENNQCGVNFMKQLTGFNFSKYDKPRAMYADVSGFRIGNQYGTTSPSFHVLPEKGVSVLGYYPYSKHIAVAEKKTGVAADIFCAPFCFPPAFLIHIAKKCGVQIFTESLDFSDANENLFTMHAKTPGLKKVKLPYKSDVLDVFNRKIIARNADQFEFNAPLHSSWLFYYGKDAEKLLNKLNKEYSEIKY